MIFLKTPSLTLPLHMFWAVMAKIRVSDEEEKQNVVSSLSLVVFGLGKIEIGKGRRKRRYRRKKSEESVVGNMQRKRQFWRGLMWLCY